MASPCSSSSVPISLSQEATVASASSRVSFCCGVLLTAGTSTTLDGDDMAVPRFLRIETIARARVLAQMPIELFCLGSYTSN